MWCILAWIMNIAVHDMHAFQWKSKMIINQYNTNVFFLHIRGLAVAQSSLSPCIHLVYPELWRNLLYVSGQCCHIYACAGACMIILKSRFCLCKCSKEHSKRMVKNNLDEACVCHRGIWGFAIPALQALILLNICLFVVALLKFIIFSFIL